MGNGVTMTELARLMGEAISTERERRHIENEAKLEQVLREQGWCKRSEAYVEFSEEITQCIKDNQDSSYTIFISDLMSRLQKMRRLYVEGDWQEEDKNGT